MIAEVLSIFLIFAIGMDAFMPYIVGYFDVHHQHVFHTLKLMFVDATKNMFLISLQFCICILCDEVLVAEYAWISTLGLGFSIRIPLHF